MRVLSNAPDPRFGGPLKRSLSVARRLRPKGIDTVFLIPNGDNRFVEQARNNDFECIQIDQPRIRSPDQVRANIQFLAGFYKCVTTAKSVINKHDIDIVHVNGPLNYAVAFAAARSDASLVWHFNDTLTPTPLKELSAALAERWADRIVVAADAVSTYFFDESVDTTTLYAPVDLEKYDPSKITSPNWCLSEELSISAEIPIIGTVGNINPAKGHEYLIEAFADIGESAHLVIVGKQLESQQQYYDRLVERLAELGIETRVTFLGWRDDIPRLLGSFDVFVLASITEACPMVVLEAMAIQCPVVATDVGGVSEQIPGPDYGWVVPPKDPHSLSTAIEGALTAEDSQIRTTNARQRVEERFSLEACASAHAAVYQSVNSRRQS
ncbi:glycosyltransferase family 1 protein [Halorubrum sp. ASP1]|uniref:glycosyltransferase family 4 protein n=1 Tax=Halorubrum sp. ASP1 TaxID=2518114 RepID=UPI0010F6CF1B|nr:glycosyltransferase family 4 protein [Halorubrum sp. ASP1]TKX62982.1 glycosyltransferase family 1 protein [Halorubrum sp. ASP1]